MEKYQFSVFDAISTLHSCATGTVEILWEQSDALYFWLKWRIDEGWSESFWAEQNSFLKDNEEQIRQLAIVILESYKKERRKFDPFDVVDGR